MNYSALLKGLLKEVFAFKQYRSIKKPLNVLAFIGVFPFVAASFVLSIFYIFFDFIFNGIASCTRYLEKWVDEKKKGIHPATEAVLFLITMPTCFFFNVLLSGFALFYYFTWFVLQINLFIATLSGTKWQPYIANARFDDDDLAVTTSQTTSGVFAIASFVILLLITVISLFAAELGSALFTIYEIGLLIAVPLIFKKGRVEASEEAIENDDTEQLYQQYTETK